MEAFRTLCDEGLKVEFGAQGDTPLLRITDGVIVAFRCELGVLRTLLAGAAVQLSAAEGYCLLRPQGETITVEFSLREGPKKRCAISAGELQAAVQEVFG